MNIQLHEQPLILCGLESENCHLRFFSSRGRCSALLAGVSGVRRALTFGSLQLVSCAFTPARRMDVGRVGVHPEVVAVGVAIEMEPQPVTTNLEQEDDDDV